MDDTTIRESLHSLLVAAFSDLDIHYLPSGNQQLEYPCVVYEPKSTVPSFAGNSTYIVGTRFQVTILSNRPGYSNRRNIYSMSGVTVVSNSTYLNDDIVHDVFTVTVNVIT